ncbi:MAG: hypothetical protein Tsb002_30960 [Wenzhouxiangellaceae bacterium]
MKNPLRGFIAIAALTMLMSGPAMANDDDEPIICIPITDDLGICLLPPPLPF